MKIVECVPNFSEGKDTDTINQIADEIKKVKGVKVLDINPDKDYNRTVITFVGDPESVKNAAYNAIAKAAEIIDMSKHKGEHPRIGATDVCPFVPVSGVSMDECVRMANELGKRVGETLKIPVYLYERAAKKPERTDLATIRKGEYEGLAEKLKQDEWKPEYGPSVFNVKSGATIIGVREFLIAYNVNLDTNNVEIAKKIAGMIRESGRLKKNEDGKEIRIPGTLKCVKAIGVLLKEHDIAQVSINLVDYKKTGLHTVFEEVKKWGKKFGVNATGSEIIGLCSLKAIVDAGKYYSKDADISEKELIDTTIKSLGLSQLDEFVPEKKIIEYMISDGWLVKKTVREFIDEVASSKPTPGGGSVSGLAGSLAAALTSMVSKLTIGKSKYAYAEEKMKEFLGNSEKFRSRLTELIEEDTDAFNGVMAAYGMPKETDEQKLKRQEAIESALKHASEVPFEVARTSYKILELLQKVVKICNVNAISDAGVATLLGDAAVQGAIFNVKINLKSIKDGEYKTKVGDEIEKLSKESLEKKQEIISCVEGKLC